jgi:hypothetical protein
MTTLEKAMSLREFTIKPPKAKNSAVQIQQQQPRNIQRIDVAPSKGYALVVDGHFKTQYEVEAAARKAAADLLGLFPNLRVEIYDASTKVRTLVK